MNATNRAISSSTTVPKETPIASVKEDSSVPGKEIKGMKCKQSLLHCDNFVSLPFEKLFLQGIAECNFVST